MEDTKPNVSDHIHHLMWDKTQFAVFECTMITLPELHPIIPIREEIMYPIFDNMNRIFKNVQED